MSKAQLDQFVESVSNPAAFGEATGGAEDLQQCARNVVQYAKAHGYELTEEEARAWLADRAGGELKDSQLDTVAAGAAYMRGLATPGAAVGGPQPHMAGVMGDGSVPAVQYDLKGGLKL